MNPFAQAIYDTNQRGMSAIAAISAGLGVAQGVGNMIGARKAQKRQFKHDQQMAQFAYDKDLEMWNRQNEYNSPIKQMQRLKEAGLNPLQVYGSGATAGNTSGNAPKYQQVRASNDYVPLQGLASSVSAYQDYRHKKVVTDNVEAIATKNRVQTASELLKQTGISLENQKRAVLLEITTATKESVKKQAEAKLNALNKQIDVLNARQANILQDTANKVIQKEKLEIDRDFRKKEYEDYRDKNVRPQDHPAYREIRGYTPKVWDWLLGEFEKIYNENYFQP